MAAIGESSGTKAWNKGKASGYVWVSSSPSPAEVLELEGRFPDVVRIPVTSLEESSACWREKAILARTFQRWVPPDAFIREFRRAGVAGDIQPLSLAHRCHIFRFEDSGSKEMVIGRPWVINGQPVAIEQWRPEFVPAEDAVSSALLWVRLPSLPVEFWHEEVLRAILEPAGEFLYADSATRSMSRGGFARACLRVDLRLPLRPGVRIQGSSSPFWQQFQFEYLEGICPYCGSLHLNGPCSQSSPSPAAQHQSAGLRFGPWMSASRRRRPAGADQRKASSSPGSSSAAADSPAAASVKQDRVAEGWQIPAKVARRRAPTAGKASVSVMADPAAASDSQKMGIDHAGVRSGGSRRVPTTVFEGPVPVSVIKITEVQTIGSELQPNESLKSKDHNPFALLGAAKWKDGPSARVDANPGSSKRARPEESQSVQSHAKRELRKGKGTASLIKGSKGKFSPTANLNPARGPSTDACRLDKAVLGQESVDVTSGGQFSKEVNGEIDLVPSCLTLANQGQSGGSAPPVNGSRAVSAVPETDGQRTDIPTMDCTSQSDEGGTSASGHISDAAMMEDQGGLHPFP